MAGVSPQGALAPQPAGVSRVDWRRDPTKEERGDRTRGKPDGHRPLFLDLPHSWLEQTGNKLAPSAITFVCHVSGWTKAQPYERFFSPIKCLRERVQPIALFLIEKLILLPIAYILVNVIPMFGKIHLVPDYVIMK